jgi:hypothetical protein
MTDDVRCCGTGTCLINEDGYCWCGQQWDGEKMCFSDKPNSLEHESELNELESKMKRKIQAQS